MDVTPQAESLTVIRRPIPQRLGKYEVRREVGRGGMGIVYEGYDPMIERRVALKTFLGELFDGTESDNVMTRLRREAQAAGRLSHRNIIAVYDFGEEIVKDGEGKDADTAFIAMEFIEGRSLENHFEAQERFSVKEVQRIMGELLDALEYSHEHGVVHRDIKPANIILLTDGTVKVADFGIARIESAAQLTQVGTVMGSPAYMSPEQFLAEPVDGRSDLYSAAVVLYRLLTGELPFVGNYTATMHRVLNDRAPPPSALSVLAPKGFDAVLARAMARRPEERYQTAAEFKQAIAAAVLPQGPQQPPARPRPALWIMAPVALLAIGAVAYYLWGMRRSALPQAVTPVAVAVAASVALAPAAPPPEAVVPPANADSTVITAVGVAAPLSKGQEPAAAGSAVTQDARRQLVAKAAALYVQPNSLNSNYSLVNTQLLARSDDFIKVVLQEPTPLVAKNGSMYGIMKANVSVRDVQKSLNQISHDYRVEFIRNHGDPCISVAVSAWTPETDSAAGAQASPVAENLLKEHIRSFGFVVVDDAYAKPPADFHVDGEVRFKRLSARLPASGLTIEKFVLTSWTVKAVDVKTGEEIYHNTTIPEKQSWATEELALQDVGRLIGAEFSQNFFLQYFDFRPSKARIRFSGLPPASADALLDAVTGSLVVLNAVIVQQSGSDVIIDAEMSAGSTPLATLVQQSLLEPFNKMTGAICFSMADGDAAREIHVAFNPSCSPALGRLVAEPRDALAGSRGTSL